MGRKAMAGPKNDGTEIGAKNLSKSVKGLAGINTEFGNAEEKLVQQ